MSDTKMDYKYWINFFNLLKAKIHAWAKLTKVGKVTLPTAFGFQARIKTASLTEIIQRVVDLLKDLVRRFNKAVQKAVDDLQRKKDACYKLNPKFWIEVKHSEQMLPFGPGLAFVQFLSSWGAVRQ